MVIESGTVPCTTEMPKVIGSEDAVPIWHHVLAGCCSISGAIWSRVPTVTAFASVTIVMILSATAVGVVSATCGEPLIGISIVAATPSVGPSVLSVASALVTDVTSNTWGVRE